jgi:tetratricopeptide (TPR) repeat protein
MSYRILSILAITTCTTLAEESPRATMKKGLRAYQSGVYTNAVESLKKTVLTYPDLGHFNLGAAYFKQHAFKKAATHFQEALRSPDPSLQADAYYNRGNALLAQTTQLTGPEDIVTAIQLAFEAMEQFESSLRLKPDKLDAKQNFERAVQLRLSLEFKRGKWLFDHAEKCLQETQAKQAYEHYQKAQKQFEKILSEIDPIHPEAIRLLPRTKERIAMLAQAVTDAQTDLTHALRLIQDYQYLLAANILVRESTERTYAFDIQPELKTRYEQILQKNQQIITIVNNLLKDVNKAK